MENSNIYSKFIVIFSLFSLPCFAASFSVTNNLDSGAGSFRQAIIELNNSSDSSNTISFNSNYSIALGSDLPVIQKPVFITGNSSIIDGNGHRGLVFNAQPTDIIQVDDIQIMNAVSQGGRGGDSSAAGGGGGAGLGGGNLCYSRTN